MRIFDWWVQADCMQQPMGMVHMWPWYAIPVPDSRSDERVEIQSDLIENQMPCTLQLPLGVLVGASRFDVIDRS